MPEYLSPGVYIEEISTGPVPIEGVSTSTAGFVGQTERGPTVPMLITSFTEYQRWYGSFTPPAISYLPFAVKGFFENGGKRVFVARVTGAGAKPANFALGALNLEAEAIGDGSWGNRIFIRVKPSSLLAPDGKPVGFRLTVLYYGALPPLPLVDPLDKAQLRNPDRREPEAVEDFDNLRTDPRSPDYVLNAVNSSSLLVKLSATAAVVYPDGTLIDYKDAKLDGGDDGAAATAADYIGSDAVSTEQRRGLAGLDTIDDISLLCVPDEDKFPDVTPEIVNQCELRKDRFAILQFKLKAGIVDDSVRPPLDSSYAAIYLPWIRVFNPVTLDYPLVPPGGHIAGVYARADEEVGVHKAPANYEIKGIVVRDIDTVRKPLEYTFGKGQQDILNPRGVNVLRDFRNRDRGIQVYGARTMSSNGQWKYINVRRLFIFVEQSIERGTQWVVFEPNDEPTWKRVSRSISNFLTTVWLNGALMGSTAEEAFFVKIDRSTMTQDDIDNGRLICLVGIAPVKPAEFVIFRFSQKTIEVTK